MARPNCKEEADPIMIRSRTKRAVAAAGLAAALAAGTTAAVAGVTMYHHGAKSHGVVACGDMYHHGGTCGRTGATRVLADSGGTDMYHHG